MKFTYLLMIGICLFSACVTCPYPESAYGTVFLQNRTANMNILLIADLGFSSLDTSQILGDEVILSTLAGSYYIVMQDSLNGNFQTDTLSHFSVINSGRCNHLESLISFSLNGRVVLGRELELSY